ncbi:MAG: cytochrome c [Caldilineaceae bacterium]
MEHEKPAFIQLGLLINVLMIVALAVLVLRAVQPALAGVMNHNALMMQGNGSTNMGVGRGMSMGMGMGMGMDSNRTLMTFHHAEIPAAYANLSNPIAADEASLARGEATYGLYCTSCHGESGMGDGVAAQTLDPAPAPIARTSQMLSDGYLFWRISEGGAHFATAMPAWDVALDEQTRWDLINYMRNLGSSLAADPAAEAALHEAMVRAGVEQGVITQAEGDTFLAVHRALDAYMAANRPPTASGPMMNQQEAMLTALTEAGTITQAEADTFLHVRDQLLTAGLMQ